MSEQNPQNDNNIYQVPVEALREYSKNPRKGDTKAIAESLRINGQYRPIVVRRETHEILAGNHTWKAAKSLGWKEIKVIYLDDLSDEQAKRIVLADNRYSDLAEYNDDTLAELLKSLDTFDGTGYHEDYLKDLLEELSEEIPIGAAAEEPAPSLADRFLVPPFSILDQRSGIWQDRRAKWMKLGIRSEEGRGEELTFGQESLNAIQDKTKGVLFEALSASVPNYYDQKRKAEKEQGRTLDREEFERDFLKIPENSGLSSSGTSVFDPVVCELAYRWFEYACT